MNRLKISLTVVGILFCTLAQAAPQKIERLESKIVEKYKNDDFYEINQDFMQEAVNLIDQKQLKTFHYSFPLFQDAMHMSVKYPNDQNFKIYTFDIGGGGTMGEFQSYVQFKAQPSKPLKEIETGYVQKIEQIKLKNESIYLLKSYYKGSTCVGVYSLQAFKAVNQKLIKTQIFHTKRKAVDEISVDYDCHYDIERNGNYIHLSNDLKTLDIQFLDDQYQPQPKVIRYQLNNSGYVYQGIFKR